MMYTHNMVAQKGCGVVSSAAQQLPTQVNGYGEHLVQFAELAMHHGCQCIAHEGAMIECN